MSANTRLIIVIPSSPIKAQHSTAQHSTAPIGFKQPNLDIMLQNPPLYFLEAVILRPPSSLNTRKTILSWLSSTVSLTRRNPFWSHSPLFPSIIFRLERICNPIGLSLEISRFKYRPRLLKSRLYPTWTSCLRHINSSHCPAWSTYRRVRKHRSF